jgi:hypothetical protein
MPNTWTPVQVLSLAPDEASRKNASALSTPRKWLGVHQNAVAGHVVIWGECQGSGADAYRCQVDVSGPAFKCSCPSRKLPCKHALGLFLLFVGQPKVFENSTPPDWVTAWLVKRAEQSERRAAKAEASEAEVSEAEVSEAEASDPKHEAAVRVEAQARRAAGRARKIRAGLDDLETWLHDLLRQGLASAQALPRPFWETTAARLVDAQAPGLARLVRGMPELAASGDGWQGRLLDQVSRLVLAVEGYRRIESLPENNQADLRAVIGYTIKQEELQDQPGVRDTWLVLGRELEEEAGLKTQRMWLWGQSTGRPALVLSFAVGGAALDASLAPGMMLPADLVFYPGAFPLRAFVRERRDAHPLPARLPGWDTLVEATAGYAAALAANPWLERYPMAVNNVRPLNENGDWLLCDAQGRCIPLARFFLHGWTLMAYSGGQPIGVFGEWNGERLLPLSTWADGQFWAFPPRIS